MLRQRVLTALVAAPFVLGVIFYAPLVVFAGFFLVLAAAGAFEWFRLAPVTGGAARIVAWALFVFSIVLFVFAHAGGFDRWLLLAACMWWLLPGAIGVVRYPPEPLWMRRPLMHAAAGAIVLAAAWYALVSLRAASGGAWLVMWTFAIVWSADIGAYFAGRRFGRRKLAPEVSPGKTWEGAWGGLAAAVLVGALVGALVPALAARLPAAAWAVLALPLAAISIVGDLFESVLKRTRGVKDSGRFFPGHGGALDRIDSVIAVAPFFAAFVLLQAAFSA
jgi:phosphatidate cytidylyltransferase